MKIRALIGAALAALATTASGALATPASATERVWDYSTCINRNDFTAFFRNHSAADKYCFSATGPNPTIVFTDMNHVTWFHAGVNRGQFEFIDGADNIRKIFFFNPGDSTGCTDCQILSLTM